MVPPKKIVIQKGVNMVMVKYQKKKLIVHFITNMIFPTI
jgi:hypothetical protein